MNKSSNKIVDSKKQVDDFIHSQENLSLLRFITCGSVDDGKSTLIGRILFESQTLFDDQINDLKNDSKKHGTQGEDIDYALLVDGLSAEREQGITIDVAYRFFQQIRGNLLLLIPLAMNNIQEIWLQEHLQQMLLLF